MYLKLIKDEGIRNKIIKREEIIKKVNISVIMSIISINNIIINDEIDQDITGTTKSLLLKNDDFY